MNIKSSIIAVSFVLVFATLACAADFKEGWNDELLKAATDGCTLAILVPQIEAYKQKANYTGDGIPEKLEQILPMLEAEFSSMCSCLMEQAAQTWDVEDFKVLPREVKDQFNLSMFCSNTCQIAFDAPIDCRSYQSKAK